MNSICPFFFPVNMALKYFLEHLQPNFQLEDVKKELMVDVEN